MFTRSLYIDTNNNDPPRRNTSFTGPFYSPTETSLKTSTPIKTKKLGLQDAQKETVKIEEINRDRFKNLVNSSNYTLLRIRNVFPFDLFTDEISIEVTQVNVIKRYFIATAHLQTIPIKNVADIFVQTSLLFASLKIIDSSYIENSIQVEYLKKSDACQARRIIQGLVIANKEGIDIAKVPPETLLSDIESLGKARELDL